MLKINVSLPPLLPRLLRFSRHKSPPRGYTLAEVLVVTVVIGILSGMVVSAKPWYENPVKNSQDRLSSAIKLARTRAMTSTSTYRITADPDNPNEAIRIQRVRSNSCNANTTLAQDVAAGETTITVDDVNGFAIGDSLRVGGTLANALSVNFGDNTITLGAPVGEKTTGARVAAVKNWQNDGAFLAEDLNVNQKNAVNDPDIRLVAKFNNTETTDWSVCISTRGLVRLSDNGRSITSQNLDLVLKNTSTNEQSAVRIAPGGAIEAMAIAN